MTHKQFWLVKKTDDALLGSRKGTRTKKLLAGPFPDSTAALEAMKTLGYGQRSLYSGEWVAIVCGVRPKDTIEYFEFFDHYHEDQIDPGVLERESKWDKYLDDRNKFPK